MHWFVSATGKSGKTYKIPATNQKHASDNDQQDECLRMVEHFKRFGYTDVAVEAY